MTFALFAPLAILAAAQSPVPEAPVQSPYQRGVEARLAGDAEQSARLLEPVVAAEPGNADARLQLGLALLALGRLDEAEAQFSAVLAIAPTYQDARDGLASVTRRRADPEAGRWRADLDMRYSWLDGTQPDWKEASYRLGYKTGDATTITAGLDVARRFGFTDVMGLARLDTRVSADGSLYLAVGATPDGDFLPKWQIEAGGSLRVRDGGSATVLTLEARQARYDVGDIQTVSPGIEQYLANGRLWLTGRWINLFDETGRHLSGWLARGDVLASDRLRLFAGAADAPDTAAGRVIRSFSVFGGLSYDASERVTLRGAIAREDRRTGADRTELSIGAGFRL